MLNHTPATMPARTGRRAPKLEIVEAPRPSGEFDFEGLLKWESAVYAADPTGGDPARF